MKIKYVLKAVSSGALAAALVLTPTVVTSSNVALAAYSTTTTTSTTATSNTSLSQYGGQPTVTATVAKTAGTATPTGKVTFTVTYGSGTVFGVSEVTLPAGGSVTYQFPATAPANRTYNVQATYSGDANYSTSSGSTNVTIYERPTTTVIGTTSATGNKNGRKIQATISVQASGGIGTPTGTVTLSCTPATGTTTSSPATPLDASGTATASCSTVEGTSYTLTATYSGDANKFVGSTSAGKTQTG